MANYVQMARSSYFATPNLDKLLAWANPRDLGVWHGADGEKAEDGTPLVGLYLEGESFPSWIEVQSETDPDDWKVVEVDVLEELREHIAEGWCVIVMSIGYEKLRYLVGEAWVITRDKIEYVSVLDKAAEIAKATGLKRTLPEY